MNTAPSIAQEFYKLREEWSRVDKLKTWRLAVWVAQFTDVDIIDKFMETEQLPIGVFEDIFFRFETSFKGDIEEFEKELWDEYKSWFDKPPTEKMDTLLALRNDGLLDVSFEPSFDNTSGFEALMNEMLRLKAAIKGFENINFCIYFPPIRPEATLIKQWLHQKLKKEIPLGIRLITLDFAAKRKIEFFIEVNNGLVMEITPQLNMTQAINNEMNKGGGSSDSVGIDNRFRQQIRVVMESTTKNSIPLTSKEVKTLLSLAKQIGGGNSSAAALLVASQAHFSIKDNDQSELYADKAIKQTEVLMQKGDPAGYPTWKACMMLKGATLAGKRKWEEAIAVYDKLAEEATKNADAFFIMEGHRISGHLYYVRGRMQPAWERLLLAMVAGSYLDKTMIRQSTFLHAAHLALFIGTKIKTNEEIAILESQLADWIGDDWRDLIEEGDLEKTTLKVKKPFPLSFG